MEEIQTYVFGQPEAIPILLRIFQMKLLVQFKVQLSPHADVLIIE